MGLAAAHGLDTRRPERRAVERAHRDRRLAVAAAVPFLAKGQVAAGVELNAVAHPTAVALDEADHAAVVVAVGMAEDQAVELIRLDPQEIEVAVHDLRREAEIEQISMLFSAFRGFEVQRQAPFAGQGRGLPAGDARDVLYP